MDLREIAIKWLSKAKEIKAGREIYIPCNDKNSRKRLLKVFEKELKVMSEIDPVSSSCLTISGLLKEGQHWIVVKKKLSTPIVGWIKSGDGNELERVELESDPERSRRIKLMVLEETLSDEEIADIEGTLSEEDLTYIHSLRKECGMK